MSNLKMSFKKSDHNVGVDTYIGALRSLSIVASEINDQTNKTGKLKMNVVAERPGSFESIVEFALTAGPIMVQVAPSMLELISIAIELYKMKRHASEIDRSKTVKIDDDHVQLNNNNGGGIMVVQNITYKMFNENQTVQDALAGTFTKMSDDETVEGFTLESDKDSVTVGREEFTEMSRKIRIEPKDQSSETVSATLIIIKPILEKSDNKWTFLYGDVPINARIADEEFLDDVVNAKHSFTTGDRLIVEMQIEKEYDERLRHHMPKSHTVLRVKDHLTADEAEQISLL